MTLSLSVQLPGPQSYLGLKYGSYTWFFFLFIVRVRVSLTLTLKIFTSICPKCTQPQHILHFVSPVAFAISLHKRTGYSCWPWKVSEGTEQEPGCSFTGLVTVVWVCCSVFMHAANVGHTRNYSGNLRRPVVSILELLLKIQTLLYSFMYNNAASLCLFAQC